MIGRAEDRLAIATAELGLSRRPTDTLVIHGLGSCLGVAAYDPVERIGALLHVMLPTSTMDPARARENPCRFVDTGLAELLRRVCAAGADRRRLVLSVAGGARIHADGHEDDVFAIGRRNVLAFKKAVWQHGVLISAQDVGGTATRTMSLALDGGRVVVCKRG